MNQLCGRIAVLQNGRLVECRQAQPELATAS
jgi:hypothetical protein